MPLIDNDEKLLQKIVPSASKLHEGGMEIHPAVWKALDKEGIFDPPTRKRLSPKIYSRLGRYGGNATAKLRREEMGKKQILFCFPA